MSAPIATALGTLFAPAAGAAAGAAAGGAAAGFGSQLFGSLIAGVGSGLMKKAEYKQQRDDDIAAEDRRAARYSGVGDAMQSAWSGSGPDSENATAGSYGFQRVDANSNRGKTLGDRETPRRMGDQYRKPKQEPKRYRYDRASGAIVMG